VAFLAHIDMSKATCNTCLTNSRVACISDTQYYQCNEVDNVLMPDNTRIYSCNPGEVCADTATGCTRDESILRECELCNACNPAGFTCTSLDTYAQCSEGNPVSLSVRCASNQFCDNRGTNRNQMCMPSTMTFPTCNVPATSTTGDYYG
jgi:hypothetical protein